VICSGMSLKGEVAIGMRAQLVSIATEGQHGAYTGQTPGTAATFHAMDHKLVDIAFNGSQAGREGAVPVFQVQYNPSWLLRTYR
jgi:hypothetical protein